MDDLLRYWPIFAFLTANVFGLGVMWWKVESARASVNILFKKVDELKEHTFKHCGELNVLKDSMKRIEVSMAATVIRVDQIFNMLTMKDKK